MVVMVAAYLDLLMPAVAPPSFELFTDLQVVFEANTGPNKAKDSESETLDGIHVPAVGAFAIAFDGYLDDREEDLAKNNKGDGELSQLVHPRRSLLGLWRERGKGC